METELRLNRSTVGRSLLVDRFLHLFVYIYIRIHCVASVNWFWCRKRHVCNQEKMWKKFAHFHQKRCSDSIFRRHRFVIKIFARNIGKIEGKVIGGVDDHYIFWKVRAKGHSMSLSESFCQKGTAEGGEGGCSEIACDHQSHNAL